MSRSRDSQVPLLGDSSVLETFKAKLVYQLKKKGWKSADLARELKVSATAVGKWVRTGTIGKMNLVAMAQAFGKPVTYFMNPDIPLEDDDRDLSVSVVGMRTEIKAVQIRDYGLAHGKASKSIGALGPIISLMVRKSWLDENLPVSADSASLFLFTVQTDAMDPTMSRGDVLFVDTTANEAAENGLYLVCIRGIDDVRRLQVSPDGSVVVSCDNSVYDSFVLTNEDRQSNNFTILGRVVLPLALRNI